MFLICISLVPNVSYSSFLVTNTTTRTIAQFGICLSNFVPSLVLSLVIVIGAFGDYRVIGHVCLFVCLSVCLFVCLSVCPTIFYETIRDSRVKFCG